MKKFTWRLQRVLDLKQKQQQAKKSELLKITEQLAVTRTILLAQKRILADAIENVAKNEPRERLTRQPLLLQSSRQNDKLIKKLLEKVAELQKKQHEATVEFLKLKRAAEAMEKLRERTKQKFIAQQEKIDQKEMDERTTLRFARKMKVPQNA